MNCIIKRSISRFLLFTAIVATLGAVYSVSHAEENNLAQTTFYVY